MVVSYDDLKKVQQKNKKKTMVIVAGCFDLLHVGHVRHLKRCAKLGDKLVVIVRDDISLKKYKGDERPIILEDDRIELIDSLACVDYVLKMKEVKQIDTNLKQKYGITNIFQENSLWKTFVPAIEELNPDIICVNDTNQYKSLIKKFKEFESKLVIWRKEDLWENISTSEILLKKNKTK